MQLFYNPDLVSTSTEVIFSKEESKHIAKVLRKQDGDTLQITNGKGYMFQVTLTLTNPKKCQAKVLSTHKQETLPYSLHLAVAPTKLNDRYEWFLEKATEIGITEITPIICDHSERKIVKLERLEKKVISAMKQSLKAYAPIVHPVISFSDFIKSQENSEQQKYIAYCEESDKKSLKSLLEAKQSILILIGPEGDFSTREIEMAKLKSFVPVSLGTSRLRTETAALVACHSVAFINEELS